MFVIHIKFCCFSGNVYGRKALNLRVCSCPKRDKDKEESAYLRNPITAPQMQPQGKKRKMENKAPSQPNISFSLNDTNKYDLNVSSS